jgi:glycosyltransferase involved in cell wall biosynthesis
MTEPAVTVLTTTYNRSALLSRLHESRLRQTFREFEWLIVDDGSSDATAVVVAELAEKSGFEARYLHQPNRGKHAALNAGVAAARGRYCAVIDSDDWYEPEALAVLISEWRALPAPVEFAEVQGLCATPNGHIIGSRLTCAERMDSDVFEMSFRFGVRGDKIGMIRTDVLRQFPFPEELGRFVTEALVWHRIANRYRTRYMNRVLARKEYQPGGLSRQEPRRTIDHARMYHVFFKEIVQTPRPIPVRQRYRAYANWVRNGLLAGQPLRADWRQAPSRLLFLLGLPTGAALALRDRGRVTPDA